MRVTQTYSFHSNGKLLITGEYAVLDGALAFALPTRKGQTLEVTENNEQGRWQAFDSNGNLVDLDVIKKLDAIFDDFRLYVKITGKLSHATELLHKEAEDFDWESL